MDEKKRVRVLRADGYDEKSIPTEIINAVMKRKYCFEIRMPNGDIKYAYTNEPKDLEKYAVEIGAKIVRVDVNDS